MHHAGHLEWGYLAPAPSFIRTARVVLVAAAIGVIAGAGIVFSLVSHAPIEASVSARTLASRDAPPERAGSVGLFNSQSSLSPVPQMVANQSVDSGSTRQALAASAEGQATNASPAETIVLAAPAAPTRADPAPIKTMKKPNNAPHYASRGELLEPTQRGNYVRRHRDVYSETPAPGGYSRYGGRWSGWSYWDGVSFYQDW